MKIEMNKSPGWVFFRVKNDKPLTREDIKEMQKKSGYMVDGYGLYSLKVSDDGKEASWKCSDSAD